VQEQGEEVEDLGLDVHDLTRPPQFLPAWVEFELFEPKGHPGSTMHFRLARRSAK
jgi:hypothetical protein